MSTGNALAPIHDAHLVELTGVHPVTVRRWKKLTHLPRWLERLVRVCLHGELGEIDRAWRGWSIRRGELVSPEGLTYTPGAVRASTLWRSRALELGDRERRKRVAFESDPANFEDADRLAAMHRALEEARQAFEQITNQLTTSERNRIFCSSAPAPRPRVVRRVATQNGVGASLLLELVDASVGALRSSQRLVDLAPEGRERDAAREGGADECEHQAFRQRHL